MHGSQPGHPGTSPRLSRHVAPLPCRPPFPPLLRLPGPAEHVPWAQRTCSRARAAAHMRPRTHPSSKHRLKRSLPQVPPPHPTLTLFSICLSLPLCLRLCLSPRPRRIRGRLRRLSRRPSRGPRKALAMKRPCHGPVPRATATIARPAALLSRRHVSRHGHVAVPKRRSAMAPQHPRPTAPHGNARAHRYTHTHTRGRDLEAHGAGVHQRLVAQHAEGLPHTPALCQGSPGTETDAATHAHARGQARRACGASSFNCPWLPRRRARVTSHLCPVLW